MLRPVVGRAELREVSCVGGGLVNTIYRISTGEPGEVYGLRVYAKDGPAMETERRLLRNLVKTLPVPKVLFADAGGEHCAYPYLVYEWLEGITLNECRRENSREDFLTLAEPLGRLLAQIASAAFTRDCISGTMRAATLLERAEGQLRMGLARERLGDALADELRDCLSNSASVLRALDESSGLVHGDFGGRNILVRTRVGGVWEISGVIDWEEAAEGSPLWDVGSLFRYHRRYSEEFRTLFAEGYYAAGGRLPADWCMVARTIDSVRLVSILSEERELPGVFVECIELIQSIVAGLSSAPTG
ncbi:MAG TPA: aminoglycoside phosphotransferase family protein [Pyrinomonadaceae bacterium]